MELAHRKLSSENLAEIQTRFSFASVCDFTGTLDVPPNDRIVRSGDNVMDADAPFHRVHLSDAAVGQWRAMIPAASQSDIKALFGPVVGMAFFEPGMRLTLPSTSFNGSARSGNKPGVEFGAPGFLGPR